MAEIGSLLSLVHGHVVAGVSCADGTSRGIE